MSNQFANDRVSSGQCLNFDLPLKVAYFVSEGMWSKFVVDELYQTTIRWEKI